MVKSLSGRMEKVVKGEKKVEMKVSKLAHAVEGSGFREYVDYLSNPWKVFWYNLFAGVARGLGFVLGATVVVAVIVYIIGNYLADLPFVGDVFEWLRQTIESGGFVNLKASVTELIEKGQMVK